MLSIILKQFTERIWHMYYNGNCVGSIMKGFIGIEEIYGTTSKILLFPEDLFNSIQRTEIEQAAVDYFIRNVFATPRRNINITIIGNKD